ALLPTGVAGKPATLACGRDARGLSYALLELADRVRHGATLTIAKPIVERPGNPVRSIMRQFTSEVLDKPWFYDRQMWPRYLDMLAAQRFNRLNLSFGLGYDQLKNVTDSYFLFLYPFLVAAPGYDVRVTNLSNAERDKNLDTLRFIAEQTVASGLDFQLGIWMHGYQLADSPSARYIVQGLTPQTQAAYCRDALTMVLREIPAISSLALRIHGESGVAEGSYDFWKTVFDGAARSGRKVELDLHAKGINARMIDVALASGLPVNLAPKFSAEHFGMPYHQAAIRELEMPTPGHVGKGLMTLSEGSRSFTRYGYADLLRDDRKYTVRHRVFSGTQRLLASGDATAAAAYARAFTFCGTQGADLMEPLTCRGRRGTGLPGTTRSGYIEQRLEPRYDWEKFAAWYRTFGRLMYNPDSDPAVCERAFGDGAKARALESAVAKASRILPIVTTAHLTSAACDCYWPEIYWNQPMAAEPDPNPYGDTPSPKVFQNVSPLDPQMFSAMSEFAGELLGTRSGKYTPLEVAQWLEDHADAVTRDLAEAGTPPSGDALRLAIDAEMQADIGRFFAAKFRSGVLYAIHERIGDSRALAEALVLYRAAREHWALVADRSKGVYADDLSASDKISERGQWHDRLTQIDQDITALETRLAATKSATDPRVTAIIAEVQGRQPGRSAVCTHTPPDGFRPGQELVLEITAANASAQLHYRHVNQAERWTSVEMDDNGDSHRAGIPAAYTASPYPLQYYFELREASGKASLYPGFDADLTNQPYFVLRRTAG
ncbi:MAG: hypothetical protein KGL29_07815, partial [Alphaproteobacteria bacterium]|nr:hypothetical protein [Alphaproteobacteria bacterium]